MICDDSLQAQLVSETFDQLKKTFPECFAPGLLPKSLHSSLKEDLWNIWTKGKTIIEEGNKTLVMDNRDRTWDPVGRDAFQFIIDNSAEICPMFGMNPQDYPAPLVEAVIFRRAINTLVGWNINVWRRNPPAHPWIGFVLNRIDFNTFGLSSGRPSKEIIMSFEFNSIKEVSILRYSIEITSEIENE